MIVGMYEHLGHMHDMQIICMSETCGPPRYADHPDMRTIQTCGPSRHAVSVTILLVSGVNDWKAEKSISIAIFISVILLGVQLIGN